MSRQGVGKAFRLLFEIDESQVDCQRNERNVYSLLQKTELKVKSIHVRKDFTIIAVIEKEGDTIYNRSEEWTRS
jgi:hypothetical protein